MTLVVLTFAATLLFAVLISEWTSRSALSNAVVFLTAGVVAGGEALDLLSVMAQEPVVYRLAEYTLIAVLLSDGLRLGIRDLMTTWRLPGRTLLLGLPLTLLFIALFGHYVAKLSWIEAFLVAAALSPTDPVLASAIVGRKGIPQRLQRLLNTESGFNDGLALPIVLTLLALIGSDQPSIPVLLGEVLLGIAIGVAVPWIAIKFAHTSPFAVSSSDRSLFIVAITLLVVSLATLSHANQFLAAFSVGITLASFYPHAHEKFAALIVPLTQLLKLAALLAFGAMIVPTHLMEMSLGSYLFAFLALFLARPLALMLVLLGSELPWRARITAAWFGPKGFASIVYGIWIHQSGLSGSDHMFHLIVLVIMGSIIVHSSTDVLFARWFDEPGADNCASRHESDEPNTKIDK